MVSRVDTNTEVITLHIDYLIIKIMFMCCLCELQGRRWPHSRHPAMLSNYGSIRLQERFVSRMCKLSAFSWSLLLITSWFNQGKPSKYVEQREDWAMVVVTVLSRGDDCSCFFLSLYLLTKGWRLLLFLHLLLKRSDNYCSTFIPAWQGWWLLFPPSPCSWWTQCGLSSFCVVFCHDFLKIHLSAVLDSLVESPQTPDQG